ncbi:MAG: hypothetical protein FJX76_00705 [Armatimonadetes bacterium]|nr:hypothetical protein [Armatimonadota bacterium]
MARIAQQQRRVEAQLRQKALLPEERFCRIIRQRITVLIEYEDYKGPHHKGPEGMVYCENIVPCYQANRQCRYSGISPLYPDPFEGVPRNLREAEELFGTAETDTQPPSEPEPVEAPE